MAEIIKFPGKASEANRSFRRERVRIAKQLKRDAELILKGTAGIVLGATAISACAQLRASSDFDHSSYASGRLSGEVRSNGSDKILRRVKVGGTDEVTRQELNAVGGVHVRLEPSTSSGIIGIAPEGTVFREVVLIDNWIGAKCNLRQVQIQTPLVDGKGDPIKAEVCWMKADYFKGKDLPK